MDITRWTIDERMRLPDYTFGNREVLDLCRTATGALTINWKISGVVWPEPCCIWEFGIRCLESDCNTNAIRVGLADACPTSEAEMNATVNILPDLGDLAKTPPVIYLGKDPAMRACWRIRKGVASYGKKLAMEIRNQSAGTYCFVSMYMIISGLPKNISGWLAHQFETEVR